MALIHCPQCGGIVSDSAEKCVHCGHSFEQERRKKEEKKKEEEQESCYNNLPEEEQKELLNEFNGKFPEEAKFEKNRKLFNITYYCITAIGWVSIILFNILFFVAEKNNDENLLPTIILFIVIACLYLVYIPVNILLRRRLDRRGCQNIKRYIKWLKEEKGYTYKVELSAKEKAVYDSVSI